jgi:putative FmdB family regulatory protein
MPLLANALLAANTRTGSPIRSARPFIPGVVPMPTYEYECTKCGHELEAFQSMKDEPLKKCPSCGRPALRRKVGGGAGLIFKGSGFYITDYKKKSGGPKEGAETKPASGKSTETKSTTTASPKGVGAASTK